MNSIEVPENIHNLIAGVLEDPLGLDTPIDKYLSGADFVAHARINENWYLLNSRNTGSIDPNNPGIKAEAGRISQRLNN